MIKLGITGEMGSGKSYICNIFESKGIITYNTDNISKKLINSIPELIREVKDEFGDIYIDGIIDREKLINIIFNENGQEKLKKLNNICHPYVFRDFINFCNSYPNEKIILAESAILYECNMDKVLDKIIYVSTPENIRIERTILRSGISILEYKNRMKSQISPEFKLKNADYIIYNYESDVDKQVDNILESLGNIVP